MSRWRTGAGGALFFLIAALGYLVGGMGANTTMSIHFNQPGAVNPSGATGLGAGTNPSVTTPSSCTAGTTATVASYTNGTAGVTPATITFTGAVPSCWKARSGITPGSAVIDTTTNSIGGDYAGSDQAALSTLSTLTLNHSASSLGFPTSGGGTIQTQNDSMVSFTWSGTSGSTLTGASYSSTTVNGQPITVPVGASVVISATFAGTNGAALSTLSTLTLNASASSLGFSSTGGTGTLNTTSIGAGGWSGALSFSWTGTSGSTLTGCSYNASVSQTNTTVNSGAAIIVPVIADQSGGPSGPLGPTIDTIVGNTITLEQSVLDGSAVVTGFTPVAIAMSPNNVGDLIEAATCGGYGTNTSGCPAYSQTASSAGFIQNGNLTWDNPAHFVGQDASPSGYPSWSAYGSAGGYGGPNHIVTMVANNDQDGAFSAVINTAAGSTSSRYNGVSAFPNTGETGAYTGEVINPSNPSDTNQYTSLVQTYVQNMPCCQLSKEAAIYGSNPNFFGWNMTEDYFSQPGDHNNDMELSIQNSYSNPGTSGVLGQNGGPAWNYGVSANDIGPIGSGVPTSEIGSSGMGSITVPVADFAAPATSMGLVAQDDPISDANGNIPANTVVTSVNELTGVIGLSNNLTGTVSPGDTITIGLLWFLQDGGQNHNSDGTCTASTCGQLVLHAGCDWSDIPDRPNPTGTIPTRGIVNWLETHAAPQSSGLGVNATWGQTPDPCENPSTGTNGQQTGPWCGSSEGIANGVSCTTSIVQDPVVGSGGDTGVWAPYGYIVVDSLANSLAQGWEILGTNGTHQYLSLSNFTITATGGQAG